MKEEKKPETIFLFLPGIPDKKKGLSAFMFIQEFQQLHNLSWIFTQVLMCLIKST